MLLCESVTLQGRTSSALEVKTTASDRRATACRPLISTAADPLPGVPVGDLLDWAALGLTPAARAGHRRRLDELGGGRTAASS